MEEECCVPPGFRFHPTEEELVGYYLAKKVASQKIDLDIIQEVDLYRMEPWDLQRMCKYYGDHQGDWYFFSYKDRKYPSGTRTNRATAAGFWKATGRDKPVMSRSGGRVIGMRKTLVFYKGRAPNGRKTDWIMHEYRLQQSNLPPSPAHHHHHQEEGWVVCRAFQKPIPNQQLYHHPSSYYPGDHHFLGSKTALMSSPPQRTEIGTSFHHGQLLYNHDDIFESKNKLVLSIPPQLIESESPTTTVDDDELLIQQGGGQAGAIDWNFLDTLLLLHDPAASSSLHFQ